MSTPIHIVMTPVRNEAWVLRAFLETTSLWADYIIIADQMSTDDSREMAKEYPKVMWRLVVIHCFGGWMLTKCWPPIRLKLKIGNAS